MSIYRKPSGRNDQTRAQGLTPWQAMAKQIDDVKTLSQKGLKFNLLFNANCYGDKAQSKQLFYSVGETIEYVGGNFNLNGITTTSPLIAKFVKQNFENLHTGLNSYLSI